MREVFNAMHSSDPAATLSCSGAADVIAGVHFARELGLPVRSAWEALSRHGNGHVYLDFSGRADETPGAGLDRAFGRNLDRLARVKGTYDADNFFHINHNIRPA